MEHRVIKEALSALEKGVPRMVRYKLKEVEPGHPGVCGGENDIFIDIMAGKKRLLIVGAGHLGQQICRLGACLGLEAWPFRP